MDKNTSLEIGKNTVINNQKKNPLLLIMFQALIDARLNRCKMCYSYSDCFRIENDFVFGETKKIVAACSTFPLFPPLPSSHYTYIFFQSQIRKGS